VEVNESGDAGGEEGKESLLEERWRDGIDSK
jgi:hypothetical protein